jgi:DNA polymerase
MYTTTTAIANLKNEVKNCTKCKLHLNRKNIVFGRGSLNSKIIFLGEAPGEKEDLMGEPFVGRAGMLLTQILNELGINEDKIYITNVVKCRPPKNRKPEVYEINSCSPYLINQIKIISPKIIIALGMTALESLLSLNSQNTKNEYNLKKLKISNLRGNFIDFLNIKILPTFHPAYVLRNPKSKIELVSDIKKAIEFLNK